MSGSALRKLGVFLALFCVGMQVAPGSTFVAELLVLGLHAHGHAHSVSIVSDHGHTDFVLSHDEREPSHPADGAHDETSASPAPDHVFHVATDETSSQASRRVSVAPAPAFDHAVLLPTFPRPTFDLTRAPLPHRSDSLGTVLRL